MVDTVSVNSGGQEEENGARGWGINGITKGHLFKVPLSVPLPQKS